MGAELMTWADDDGTAHREGCDGAEGCTGCAVTILDVEALRLLLTGDRTEVAALVAELPDEERRRLRVRAALLADVANPANACAHCGQWVDPAGDMVVRLLQIRPRRHGECHREDLEERAARGDARACAELFIAGRREALERLRG